MKRQSRDAAHDEAYGQDEDESDDRSMLGLIARNTLTVLPPVFLGALLVVGGASREAPVAGGVLQLFAILVLMWCLFDGRMQKLSASGWVLLGLLLALLLLTGLQLVPLPPEIWSRLPGRAEIADGFRILGGDLPWLPVSMAPEETLSGALKFLPPMAAFVILAKTPLRATALVLPWVVVVVATLSVMVGVAQVLGGRESPLYVHVFTNWGQPVGFMANANHQATFLLMTLPFAAVLAGRLLVRSESGDGDGGQALMLTALVAALVLGVAIAGSAAGYLLGIPAILLSIFVARTRSGRTTVALLIGAVIGAALIGFLAFNSPVLSGLGMTNIETTSLGRPDTYARTLQAIGDVMPIGSGLGSFEGLFPSHEDPALVTGTFMNHAHSDYLEFVLEYGVLGAVFIFAFLIWFAVRCVAVWREKKSEGARLRKAASIAVLIVILHSLVDYPLRAPALAGFVGVCLGLIVTRAETPRRRSEDRQAPRAQHVEI